MRVESLEDSGAAPGNYQYALAMRPRLAGFLAHRVVSQSAARARARE
jgi:hypothetical protein